MKVKVQYLYEIFAEFVYNIINKSMLFLIDLISCWDCDQIFVVCQIIYGYDLMWI